MTPALSALRLIFAGTPEFAAVALDALLKAGHKVVAVYTQPDRPAGRGRKLRPSPVKALALQHDIPVFQPSSLKTDEAQQQLAAHKADLMVVAAYGLLLPKAVLDTPRLGCLNIHASLLPRWRGAAPIQRAILAGDEQTGITIMQMDEGLDTGAMLYKLSCPIHASETAGQLHDRLAELGSQALLHTLAQGPENMMTEKQDEAMASYAKKLDKAEAVIDWSQAATHIDLQVRAFNPWPVAQTRLHGKVLRIWQAQPRHANAAADAEPGTVMNCSKDGIDVACGQGTLSLLQLQLPGGKPLDITALLNGHPDLLRPGTKLSKEK